MWSAIPQVTKANSFVCKPKLSVLYNILCTFVVFAHHAASATGQIHRGDTIVSINGVDLKDRTQEDVVNNAALYLLFRETFAHCKDLIVIFHPFEMLAFVCSVP